MPGPPTTLPRGLSIPPKGPIGKEDQAARGSLQRHIARVTPPSLTALPLSHAAWS
jgi:hypothetical protein